MGPVWPLPHRERSKALIVAWVQDSIRNVVSGKAWWPLVMIGTTGSGKTRAALCLADVAGASAYAEFSTLCDWARMAQAGTLQYSTGHPKSSVELWREWENANLGILDELGIRARASDFQYETLKRAIDAREEKPAIYISNLSLEELAQVYDDRIVSRLGCGTVLMMTGDRRIGT